MSLIERLSKNTASQISIALNLDKEREEILAYGAFNLFHTAWSIFLVALFGVLFDVLIYALFLSFTAAWLRKYSGGAHATSPNRCAIIGVIVFDGLAVLIDKFIISIDIVFLIIHTILSFLCTYYVIYKFCPVDSPSKPIRKAETIKRLRKNSFKTIYILIGITITLFVFYFQLGQVQLLKIISCISTGILWQSLTLISPGHFIIHVLDMFLKNMTTLVGEEKA
jgi:accessory gene regulator B